MTQNHHEGRVLHDIGIPRLEAFIAVATEHSFTRGALSISLTQPTVSARVAALERDLGVDLFGRLGRDIRLTDAGNALLPHARRTVHAARDAAEAIRALRVGGGGSVLIGTAPTFGTYVLPDLLQRFDAAYPDVEITIRTGRSLEVSQMILDDVVQIGFERRLGHPEIAAITLYEDDIMLMASLAHAIAQRRRAPVSDIALAFLELVKDAYAGWTPVSGAAGSARLDVLDQHVAEFINADDLSTATEQAAEPGSQDHGALGRLRLDPRPCNHSVSDGLQE